MANLSSYKRYPFAPFLLFFVSSNLFVGISGVGNEQKISTNKLAVISHEPCQSCPGKFSSLNVLPPETHVFLDTSLKCLQISVVSRTVVSLKNKIPPHQHELQK